VGQSFLGHGAHEVACALVDSGERVVVAVVVVVVVVGGGGEEEEEDKCSKKDKSFRNILSLLENKSYNTIS
jgi:hypothetical protein